MKYKTSANVVDGKLILSLPEAMTPVVWQMDLNEAQSNAFEVIQDKDNAYALISKKHGSNTQEVIAPFEDRQLAIEALMVTSKALENGHGKITPINENVSQAAMPSQAHQQIYAQSVHQPIKRGGFGKWVVVILLSSIIGAMIYMMMTMQARSPSSIGGGYDGSVSSAPSAAQSSGVPVSADDFLRGR